MNNKIALIPISLDELENMFRTLVREELEALPHSPAPEKLYKPKETAELLQITDPTLLDWTKKGKIKAHHIGHRKFYKYSEIIAALKPTTGPIRPSRRKTKK